MLNPDAVAAAAAESSIALPAAAAALGPVAAAPEAAAPETAASSAAPAPELLAPLGASLAIYQNMGGLNRSMQHLRFYLEDDPLYQYAYRILEREFARVDFATINVYEDYRVQGFEGLQRGKNGDSVHPNREGHGIIARRIKAYMATEGMGTARRPASSSPAASVEDSARRASTVRP